MGQLTPEEIDAKAVAVANADTPKVTEAASAPKPKAAKKAAKK